MNTHSASLRVDSQSESDQRVTLNIKSISVSPASGNIPISQIVSDQVTSNTPYHDQSENNVELASLAMSRNVSSAAMPAPSLPLLTNEN